VRFVISYLTLLAVAGISSGTYISADDWKRSKFLSTYNPTPFLGAFRVGCQPLNPLVGASAGSGLHPISRWEHQRAVHPDDSAGSVPSLKTYASAMKQW
jgi:hypothetical protein